MVTVQICTCDVGKCIQISNRVSYFSRETEEIAVQYSVLRLEDIYSSLAYYLNNRQEVDSYLEKRRQKAHELRQQISQNNSLVNLRQQLLTRYQTQKEITTSASSN